MRRNQAEETARFWRVALQRFDDAQHLVRGQRNTAAIYLAGYAVECELEALLISSAKQEADCDAILDSFRGNSGHDIESLKARYPNQSSLRIPTSIVRHLSYVNRWTTSLRYDPSSTSPREAQRFLDARRKS